MSGYSFDAFLQQVCDSPDLEIIHQFNCEYREYLQKMSIAVNNTATSNISRSSSTRSLRGRNAGVGSDAASEIASRDGAASYSSSRSRSRMNANTSVAVGPYSHAHIPPKAKSEECIIEEMAWKRMTSSWQRMPLPLNEKWIQTSLLHHSNLITASSEGNDNDSVEDLHHLYMIIYHNYRTQAEMTHFRSRGTLSVFDNLSDIAAEGVLECTLQRLPHHRKCWQLYNTNTMYDSTHNALGRAHKPVEKNYNMINNSLASGNTRNTNTTRVLRDIKLESLPAFSMSSTRHIRFASQDEELFILCDHDQYCSLHSLYEAQVEHRLLSTCPLTVYGGHINMITDVCISSDYALVATCSKDHTLCIFDLLCGKCLWSIIHPAQLNSVTFSCDGAFVITGACDHRCRVWYAQEINQQRPVLIYCQHHASVIALVAQLSHNLVASACEDGEVHVWQANTALTQFELGIESHNGNRILALQFSLNGRLLLSADAQRVVISDVANHGSTLLSITPPALRGVRFATQSVRPGKSNNTAAAAAALSGGSSNVNLLFTSAMLVHASLFTVECVLFATNDGTITLHELNAIYTAQRVSGLQNLETNYELTRQGTNEKVNTSRGGSASSIHSSTHSTREVGKGNNDKKINSSKSSNRSCSSNTRSTDIEDDKDDFTPHREYTLAHSDISHDLEHDTQSTNQSSTAVQQTNRTPALPLSKSSSSETKQEHQQQREQSEELQESESYEEQIMRNVHSKRIVIELKPSMWFTTLHAPICNYAIGSNRRILLVDVNRNVHVLSSVLIERGNAIKECEESQTVPFYLPL